MEYFLDGEIMDIEFHYYITYLIAARAGFSPKSSYIIAYSSQFVDDNIIAYKISYGNSQYYRNYISQTINILKPQTKLFRIYLLFHYVPGSIFEEDHRKDGKLHYLNVTPDSKNSREMLHAAFETENLYRIGIALHAYSDAWAHQNFTGYFDEFNVIKKPIERPWALFRFLGLPIGHANAGYRPDRVNKKWKDIRLVNPDRDNNDIFLQAISRIFEELYKYNHPAYINSSFYTEKDNLLDDLSYAMKGEDKNKRIESYKKLSTKKEYGNEMMREYDKNEWMNKATKENLQSFYFLGGHEVLKFFKVFISSNISFLTKYNWKNSENYKETCWFKFQQAVKEHQQTAAKILKKTKISELELDNW